jgi:hypothetical protein
MPLASIIPQIVNRESTTVFITSQPLLTSKYQLQARDCLTMPSDVTMGRKPRVVSLGRPKFIGEEYIEEFQKDFDYDVSHLRFYSQLL